MINQGELMTLFEIQLGGLEPIEETTFARVGVKERADLQRLLRSQIEIVSPGTLVIAEEFSDWEDSRRRIDLLGVDQTGKLVVIELKRNEDGEEMELQAIRYAAMVSTMTFEKAVDVYGGFLTKTVDRRDPREALLSFLGWFEPNEDLFAQDVRIVLVSADFSREVTSAVMWLNERDLDIRCVRIKPYRNGEKLLVDVQQVIPLPEAAEYQVRIREKERKERQGRAGRGNRIPISEEEFLEDFDAERPPADQQLARKLIAWARSQGLRDDFRRGATGVTFIPVVEHGANVYYPISLSSKGWICVQLRWLKDRPPFNERYRREQLIERVKSLPGVMATEAATEGFPKILIENLVTPETEASFTSILDWVLQEIRSIEST